MNNEIATFFQDDFDYDKGLQLLQAVNPLHPHIKLLCKGFNLTNKRRLIHALKSVNDKPIEKKEPLMAKSEPFIRKVKSSPQHVDKTISDKLLDLKNKNSKLFSNASYFHNELTLLTQLNQKERELRCRAIVESFDELKKNWYKIDYYHEFGRFPLSESNDKTEVTKAIEAQKRINNLRSYISKDERKLLLAKSKKTKLKIEERLNRNKFELENLLRAY